MQGNLPPEAQEKLEDLQDLQETAQQVAMQKQEAETQLTESKNALDALDSIETDTKMYKQLGELLVCVVDGTRYMFICTRLFGCGSSPGGNTDSSTSGSAS